MRCYNCHKDVSQTKPVWWSRGKYREVCDACIERLYEPIYEYYDAIDNHTPVYPPHKGDGVDTNGDDYYGR